MTHLKRFVEKRFRRFGINKKRELTRLAYEISKRDKISYKEILAPFSNKSCTYAATKEKLLRQRFPSHLNSKNSSTVYLPKLQISPKNALKIKPARLYPKNIYTEESAHGGFLTKRLREVFPSAKFRRIKSLKHFMDERGSIKFSIQDYNKRRDNFFVVKEKYDFFKRCPCTKRAFSCGYHIFNLGFGCIYECTYCYLQEYTNCPGIVLPLNTEDFFREFDSYRKPRMRIGTGEFTDSLALDNITQYSLSLIEFFNENTDITFELKTKSDNISNLLKAKHKGNVVISWSLNPEKIIKENEFYTASLNKRLDSALKCMEAGYRVGFHFDPIIHYRNWPTDYQNLVNRLFDNIPYKNIAWISLGTLRFNPHLKSIIENRFPDNKILDEELLIGFDNKLRYPEKLRFFIYQNMLYWIRKRAKNLRVYLCMENNVIRTDVLKSCTAEVHYDKN